MTESC